MKSFIFLLFLTILLSGCQSKPELTGTLSQEYRDYPMEENFKYIDELISDNEIDTAVLIMNDYSTWASHHNTDAFFTPTTKLVFDQLTLDDQCDFLSRYEARRQYVETEFGNTEIIDLKKQVKNSAFCTYDKTTTLSNFHQNEQAWKEVDTAFAQLKNYKVNIIGTDHFIQKLEFDEQNNIYDGIIRAEQYAGTLDYPNQKFEFTRTQYIDPAESSLTMDKTVDDMLALNDFSKMEPSSYITANSYGVILENAKDSSIHFEYDNEDLSNTQSNSKKFQDFLNVFTSNGEQFNQDQLSPYEFYNKYYTGTIHENEKGKQYHFEITKGSTEEQELMAEDFSILIENDVPYEFVSGTINIQIDKDGFPISYEKTNIFAIGENKMMIPYVISFTFERVSE